MTLTLAATVVALVTAVGYLIACWLWPYTNCHRCHGSGKHRSPSGKAWRACRRCKGTGARLRAGRKIANWLRGTAEKAG